ncbi:MAG: protein-L-isoaspartate O-methyltransferase [Rhizobiales bacterium]|nr:protein-L-isoaspartate O-methyltransferase [Hyphomicrobiales bacterium]
MDRRRFVLGAAALAGGALLPAAALSKVPSPYGVDLLPPLDDREAFIVWMKANRGEDPTFLGQRFDRYLQLLEHRDLFTPADKRAFLMTPREEFALKQNAARVYDRAFLDIGYGVTISGPNLVGRMTSSLAVKRGDRVLEIGTGSGYQSAYLSYLTDKVFSIEIIKPLAERTRKNYDRLIDAGYTEYATISTRNDDGYYGWEEAAPFDKFVVTCGIDHIPPPLLKQLKPDGIMVIPVGPPGAQHVLKVTRRTQADGTVTVDRADIYRGSIVPFVPFTKLEGTEIKGTHDQ